MRELSILSYVLLKPHISQNLSTITKFSAIMRNYVET